MRSSRTWLLAASMAAVGAATLTSATAEARVVEVYATEAPPPLREEVIPAPRHGYVWSPGYWNWSHRKYVWSSGHYVRGRAGYHYTPARWDRDGDRWRYYGGRWEH
jgi:hypothetical protein